MERIHMADIIPLLPLEIPPKGKSSFYVPCPKCDRGKQKKDRHLNISLAKDVFRCARCGWNGGIFDFYAYYTSTPRSGVLSELKRRLGSDGSANGDKPPYEKQGGTPALTAPGNVTLPVADIDARHAAYSALLSLLSLAPDHQKNLLDRGLPQKAVSENEYRTTPVIGVKVLAKALLDMGCNLAGVPGFYLDSGGQWTFISMRRGILIPVRDAQGRIQGLQVRRDDQAKRKYRWVSSADIEGGANGCGAEGWIHMAGLVRERIILIEGPLKADVVYQLTGQTAIAVPGVNSLKRLEATLAELQSLGMKRIMTAFDMDFLKNPHVRNGYGELTNLLRHMGIHFGTYLWDPNYNGLDDYVWECCLNRGLNA